MHAAAATTTTRIIHTVRPTRRQKRGEAELEPRNETLDSNIPPHIVSHLISDKKLSRTVPPPHP